MVKVTQILSALMSALAMLAFFIASLAIPLSDQVGTVTVAGQGTRPSAPQEQLFFTVAFVLIVILGGEAVSVYVKQSLAVNERKIKSSPQTGWAPVAEYVLVRDFVKTSFFILLIVGMNLVFFYLFVTLFLKRKDNLPVAFWVVIGIYVVYVIIRRPLGALIRRILRTDFSDGGVLSPALATYRLQGDSIVIDLKRKRGLPPGKRPFISLANQPGIVTIRFSELDQVRTFTFVEAQDYVQYQLGPDLQLALRSTADLYRFVNGEIERPSVYGNWGSLGTILLLRGPQLFYLLSVSNRNVDELVRAFESFRSRAGSVAQAPA